MEPFERSVTDLTTPPTIARRPTSECRCTSHPVGAGDRRGLGSIARVLLGPDSPRLIWIVNSIVDPIGQLFLRALLMTVVPLVLSSLIVGVASIGDVRRLGRVGAKTLAYTLVISIVSVAIGLTLANTVRPGARLAPETRDRLMAQFGADASRQTTQAASQAGESPMLAFVRALVPSKPHRIDGAAHTRHDR